MNATSHPLPWETLDIPVMAAPMFIVSTPELVIAQCRAGIVGTMPALNIRDGAGLGDEIARIREAIPDRRRFGINVSLRRDNPRRGADMAACIDARVPIVITSMGVDPDFAGAVRGYGGVILHDVTTIRHAEKALESGVTGLIAVANGAGGHGGRLNPIAFVRELRGLHHGPLVLGGGIADGAGVLAARAMGADLAYIGTRFIASTEANAPDAYKQALLDAAAADIVYTPHFSGVPANYLAASIRAAGLSVDALSVSGKGPGMDAPDAPRAWRDIWGAGQGVGLAQSVMPVAEIVAEIRRDYAAALRSLSGASDARATMEGAKA
ncbi:nitronate monooxygenase [Pseudooceanicola sp. 216_PA32_1]|uniref:Nitronate monooxygenase n=1 Tax=Pseudooceanicola pacificus TaxID=2676438 RepID=A0A844W4W1_9RHOB|nr:nitronate monooxygenase [Pseudooceanicola pacificus]MWB78105.1 nitronate monooxygenase [Pseudooceanicola pacificus]